MKKFAITAALFSAAAFAETWTGTISDANCGAKHADASEKSMACAKACVKRGTAPVFVTGDKVLKIGNPDAVGEHVGQKVEITGALSGDTVKIDKIADAK
jgi:hypothetical protein